MVCLGMCSAYGIDADLNQSMSAAFEAHGLHYDALTKARLVIYLQCMRDWNRQHNVTRITDVSAMVQRHIIETLFYIKAMALTDGVSCLDLGSGTGVPGLPLAIVSPRVAVTLLESHGKKAFFLQQLLQYLGLQRQVKVVCLHSRQFRPAQPFDCIVCRAVAPLQKLWPLAKHLLHVKGHLYAFKGPNVQQELAVCRQQGRFELRRCACPNADAWLAIGRF